MRPLSSDFEPFAKDLAPDILCDLQRWLDHRRQRVRPATFKSLHQELGHFARFCASRGQTWVPTDCETLRQYVYEYRYQRSAGALRRCITYLRQLHRAVGVDLSDEFLDTLLKDILSSTEYTKKQPVDYKTLVRVSDALVDSVNGRYTRALLWAIYDSQFRISSILSVKLQHVKVMRPSGIVWLPPPENPWRWEEDGGFLPPSTACFLRDWFITVGITGGYLFPRIRAGRRTELKATPDQARGRLFAALTESRQNIDSVSFARVRSGALSDLQAANLGVFEIMQRSGIRTYRHVKGLLRNSDRLDDGSLKLARFQGRWGEPFDY